MLLSIFKNIFAIICIVIFLCQVMTIAQYYVIKTKIELRARGARLLNIPAECDWETDPWSVTVLAYLGIITETNLSKIDLLLLK